MSVLSRFFNLVLRSSIVCSCPWEVKTAKRLMHLINQRAEVAGGCDDDQESEHEAAPAEGQFDPKDLKDDEEPKASTVSAPFLCVITSTDCQ